MARKYDVVAITGKYTGKDGKEKMNYKSVGMVLEKDGKFYLKLNHLVTVHDDGHIVNFFNLYAPRDAAQPQAAPPSNEPSFDDNIPF